MSTTRRAGLAGAGAAMALPAVAAPAGPDAALLRLMVDLRREQVFLDRWNAGDGITWAEGEAANARWWTVLRKVIRTPARTAEGIRAKAEAARMAIDGTMPKDSRDVGHKAALALVRDVLALTGGAA